MQFIYSFPSACLRGLARHFKTEPTETVTLCFEYIRAEGKLLLQARPFFSAIFSKDFFFVLLTKQSKTK
jgi:hypothetical protein